jgi:hypothetical protein
LRRSVETRRDVHGQHAGQKASEDLQNSPPSASAISVDQNNPVSCH